MKKFLKNRFGAEEGERIYSLSQERFRKLYGEAGPKSRQQRKIFRKMLLPRVALYQILLEEGLPKEEAMKVMEEHMVICGAASLRRKYAMMDRLPFAFSLFRFGFTHVVPSSDLWDADIVSGPDEFRVTMKRCFWNDTYSEYGCPEICRYACQCDDITYGGLKHIRYRRTQTLGTGGQCCDFQFTKIRQNR